MGTFEPTVGVMKFWFCGRDEASGLMVRREQVRCLFFNPDYVAAVYRDRALLQVNRTMLLEDQQHERKGVSKGMGSIKS